MLQAAPLLLNQPLLVTATTAAPWLAVLFYGLLAGLPRIIAWLLNAPRD